MSKIIAVRVAALLLMSTLPNGFTFSQEQPSEDLVLSVLGTWTTGRITVDSTKVTQTLELKKSSDGKNYEHDWTITGADESKTSHWETKLEIAPLGKKMVSLSDSVKEKTIIKQYQSWTGVHMTGRLVAVQDKKMLWERTGEGPTGTIRELCQFDFTDPNVSKHLTIHRSLNGVPTDEGGQLITLNKQ